jgi:hypothetical protein
MSEEGAPSAVYGVLVFVCMLQLPLTLLLSPHLTRRVIRWTANHDPNNNNNNQTLLFNHNNYYYSAQLSPKNATTKNHNDTNNEKNETQMMMRMEGVVYTLHADVELALFVASALAGAWSCVYLYLGVLEERHEFATLSDSDDLGADEDEELSVVERWLEGARLGFWAWVYIQARLLWAHRAWSDAELQWLTVQRVGALYALTRTFRGVRRLRAFHVLGLVAYVRTVGDVWPLTPALLALDALLFIGHLYDRNTPIQTALNTRLFYVACASSASLAYLCASSSSSSSSSGSV